MEHIKPDKAKQILLKCEEKDPGWINRIIDERSKQGYIFGKISLKREEFGTLVYDKGRAEEFAQTNAVQLLKVARAYLEIPKRNRDPSIENLREAIKKEGYDTDCYLLLRELYCESDPEGSFYIENGLYRTISFGSLLIKEEVKYIPLPAILIARDKSKD